jgi:hypothetical protein
METYDPDRLARIAEEYRRRAEQAETFNEKRLCLEHAARYDALIQQSFSVAPITEPNPAKRRRRTDSRSVDRPDFAAQLGLQKCE